MDFRRWNLIVRPIEEALERLAPLKKTVPTWEEVLARAQAATPNRDRSRRRANRALRVAVIITAAAIPIAALAGSSEWWFFRFGRAPDAVNGVTLVQAGIWDGTAWQLTAYRSAAAGICVAMTPTGQANLSHEGAGMTCGVVTARKEPTPANGGLLYFGGDSDRLKTWIAGIVVDSAVEIDLHFEGGVVIRSPTIDAPSSFGSAVRFFVTQLPFRVISLFDRSGEGPRLEKIVGLDREGRVVACRATRTSTTSCW
jgi:hypothetical protein